MASPHRARASRLGELKRRGHSRMSKSKIVRLALAEVDLGKLAKQPG